MRGFLARGLIMFVAVAGASWMALASGTPASAAVSCTSVSGYYNRDGVVVGVPTVGYNTHNDNCELGPGNDNGGVAWLQYDLNACYGQHLAQDGIYGPLTEAAVRYAQRVSGDPDVDGIYGPQTRGYIKWSDDQFAGYCARL